MKKDPILVCHIYTHDEFMRGHDIVTFFSEQEANAFSAGTFGEYFYISFTEEYCNGKLEYILSTLSEKFGDEDTLRFFAELIAMGFLTGKAVYHQVQADKNFGVNIVLQTEWEPFQAMVDYLSLFLSGDELYALTIGTAIQGLTVTFKLSYDFLFGVCPN